MPYISFKLSDFAAELGVGKGSAEGWRVLWHIEMADYYDSVSLSNGKELSDLPGSLHIRPSIEDSDGQAIGAMHFIEAYEGSSDGVVRPKPDHYSVEIQIAPGIIRELIEKEQQGNGPKEISISVPDIHYGNLPDGSDKRWELEGKRNWTAIDGATFSFLRLEDEDQHKEDFDDAVVIAPASDPTVDAIASLVRRLDTFTQKFERATFWLSLGVGGILAATIFR